ncbi:MAG: response transcriptional repressor, RecA-mediated autopeptidase [Rhizobium sp.]|jgi:DNA polymerase V|nr:response transcriptional repressor, RecA-mediated autopeptidase [Rhizobium sp.]
MSSVGPIIAVEAGRALSIPLMTGSASAGFPSPADDYLEGPLDFNDLLIKNASATFAVRIAGDSMTGAGMFPGDIAVVDKAAEPHDRCIVLAVVNGDFTIKRFRRKRDRIVLQAENPAYQDIVITEGMGFKVWGVISKSIRML